MGGHNRLRIIGGQWRGRKLDFPDVEGLRPTPDRVRETLFNWLQPFLPGARCLDLFAGSGALGFEALSRGASEVVMVDQNAKSIAQLHKDVELFQTDKAHIVKCDVVKFLTSPNKSKMTGFNIVFLDPPYNQGLIEPCCKYLEENDWLTPEACLYLETESSLATFQLPKTFKLMRSKKAGQVSYHLARRFPIPLSQK